MLLIVIGVWKGGFIKFTLFPEVEGDLLICSLTMPTGTPFERTRNIAGDRQRSAGR